MLAACSLNVDYQRASFTCDPERPICPGEEICIDGQCTPPELLPPDGESDAAVAVDAGERVDAEVAVDAALTVDAEPPPIDVSTPETVILEAAADSFVDSSSQTQNFGGDDRVDVDANPNRNGLMRFELSSLPAGTAVQAATLRLVVDRSLDDGELLLAPLVEAWVESEVTWRERSAGLTWTKPGGTIGEVFGSFAPGESGLIEVELPLPLVQAWIDAPPTNFGLRFDSTSENGQGATFVSREDPVVADRPQLELLVVKP